MWDAKLAEAGEELAGGRAALTARLEPEVAKAYAQLGARALQRHAQLRGAVAGRGGRAGPGRGAGRRPGPTTCAGASPPSDPTATTCLVTLEGLPSRTHASQGEQRSLALALRLGGHGVVTEAAERHPGAAARRRVQRARPRPGRRPAGPSPAGQALVTTAGPLPPGVSPAARFVVRAGTVTRVER